MATRNLEARYTRRDTPDGAEFKITPAAKPGVSDVLDNSGLAGLTVRLAPFLAGLYLIFFSHGNLLGIIFGMALIGGRIAWGMMQKKKPKERPQETLLVSKSGISVNGKRVGANEIVQLILRQPGDVGRSEVFAISGDYAHAHSQAQHANLRSEVSRRSLALMARVKSSSEPVILVERLTPHVGEALMNDVWEVMRG